MKKIRAALKLEHIKLFKCQLSGEIIAYHQNFTNLTIIIGNKLRTTFSKDSKNT